jgi:UDP-N-acetyl-D-mannosaminuronic acid dehydrogenase
MKNKTVCVIGLGYIGLPTAALLASNGYEVFGVDLSHQIVETINRGQIHIVEPDLDAFVRSTVTAGKLKAFTKPQAAAIFIICVPTPFHDGDGIPQPNMDYVLSAVRSIAEFVKPGNLVILESTSPVGSTEKIASVLTDLGIDVSNISIAYCPERVLPGNIMTELVGNDRVVGGLTAEASRAAAEFYKTFVRGEVFETDSRTAEMCKLTENSFRDVNIAFANELSMICAKEKIDVWNLIKLANRHPRVNVLQPGTGVGGHCIAVDPWFIIARDPVNTRIIRSAREVNNDKTVWVIDHIEKAIADFIEKNSRPPLVACLGLAFKPDIDDLRESPALQIARNLKELGHRIVTVEPNIQTFNELGLVNLDYALTVADLFIVLVKHKQFLDPQIKNILRKKATLDFCGVEV